MKILYFTVGRDRRENFDKTIDREAISIQNIGFFDVEAGVGGEVRIAIGVGDDIDVEGVDGGEAGEVANATVKKGGVNFSGFMCFVRTCSCSLILLPNFSEHCLQANASVFSFAIRASSACCCCNRYASSAARFSTMRSSSN